jgi:hypothetical protein
VGFGVVGLGRGDVGGGMRDGVMEMEMNWLVYAHVHLGGFGLISQKYK